MKFEDNINTIEEEVKSSNRIVKNMKLVGVAALTVGAVYIAGISKGVTLGRTRGRIEGYARATESIADLVDELRKK